MKRIPITPRQNWVTKVEELGFLYHSLDSIYWDERACYSFSMDEILKIESATEELYQMCLKAAQYIIDNNLFHRLGINPRFTQYIIDSWNREDPSLYGRFDFRYGPDGVLKMLEFNADTPTSLLEASVIQWYWLQDYNAQADQFNSIHEKLIGHWKALRPYLNSFDGIHFTGTSASVEDWVTIQYLRETASAANYRTKFLDIANVGWDNENRIWLDEENEHIKTLFKLYPWEWMSSPGEPFSNNLLEDIGNTIWLEPAFKMLLSNKGLLPILWMLYPNHQYLLPAYFEDECPEELKKNCAVKPLLSREGANVLLFKDGNSIEETDGDYGDSAIIYQGLSELPEFEGNYPVFGSWVIGQQAAGMGIRESNSLITANTSRFVPHLIEG